MIKIELNNNKGRLNGPMKDLVKIQKAFKVRNPNAFFIRKKMRDSRGWDGMINYISDSFYFQLGLLPTIIQYLKENNYKWDIEDYRRDLGVKPKVPNKVGDNELRGYQERAVRSIVENKVGKVYFPMGAIKAATNAGKTTIMAGIYLAYKRKIPAIMLLNDADLFEQFKKELPKLLPAEDIGFVRGSEIKYARFTVAMAPTLSRNIQKHKKNLAEFGILLVDEADLADNKTYKSCIQSCINAMVRVGLSGTLYMSKLAKDKPKNMNIKGLFSDIVFEITKKEMQDEGYSTRVVVRIVHGSTRIGIKGDWQEEYKQCITLNEDRHDKIIKRLKHHLKLRRVPALVIGQFHEHIEIMFDRVSKAFPNQRVAYVHGDVAKRKEIIEDFRQGNIDILVGSFILRRGKNFPLLRLLINAAGSDSEETVDQILGRLERTHESKSKAYMEDFFDTGYYLNRHSKHRIIYYKNMGLKIIDTVNNKIYNG